MQPSKGFLVPLHILPAERKPDHELESSESLFAEFSKNAKSKTRLRWKRKRKYVRPLEDILLSLLYASSLISINHCAVQCGNCGSKKS